MQNLEKQFDELFGCVINIRSQEQLNNKIKLWINDHYIPKESAPPIKYRVLTKDEIIKADDEFLEDDGVTWSRVQRPCIGDKYDGNFYMPARRRV